MPTDDILWKKVDSLISQQAEQAEASAPASQQSPERGRTVSVPRRQLARKRASEAASHSSTNDQSVHASAQASTSVCYPSEWVEAARKVVKQTGKEVAFTRLTAQEKERLCDVVYGLRRQGIKTSENEVLRIAINHLLEDLRANGEASFLRRVIAALLA